MTMSEVEVDRITQQVFAALNSGLDAALVKVVIDEIEKATAVLEQDMANLRAETERWKARAREQLCKRIDGFAFSGDMIVRAQEAEAKVARVEALVESAGDLDNGILVWDLRAALGGGS